MVQPTPEHLQQLYDHPHTRVYGQAESSEYRKNPTIITEALDHPVGEQALSFADLLSHLQESGQTLLVVVNDTERPTHPTHCMLEAVLPQILSAEVRCQFAVATGTHPNPQEKDLELIFGKWLPILREKNISIMSNDQGRDEVMTTLPTFSEAGEEIWERPAQTQRGTMVRVNQELLKKNQVVIALNTVEPHPRAGFTGDYKSFWPGLGSLAEIRRNHSMVALHGQPDFYITYDGTIEQTSDRIEIGPLKVERNAMKLDMIEVVKKVNAYRQRQGLEPFYCLNVVMDISGQECVAASWGHPLAVAAELNPIAAQEFSFPIEPFEVLVLDVPEPQGQVLEQCLKALALIADVVEIGTKLVIVASLSKGLGTEGFAQALIGKNSEAIDADRQKVTSDLATFLNPKTRPAFHHAIPCIAETLKKVSGGELLVILRDNVPDEVTAQLALLPFLRIIGSLETVVDLEQERIAVITNPTMMIPRLTS